MFELADAYAQSAARRVAGYRALAMVNFAEVVLPTDAEVQAVLAAAAVGARAAAKLAAARMEQGNLSNVEWFRGIGEYKIDWGPGYRIYLAKDGLKIIVLLGGGSKKRQQQDIAWRCCTVSLAV